MFDSIVADRKRGASALKRAAARELAEWIAEIESDDPGSLWAELTAAVAELIRAQPGLAPLLNLGSDVLAAADRMVLSGVAPETVARAVVLECERSIDASESATESIGQEGLKRLEPCSKIVTHSSSEAVQAILDAAAAAGRGVELVETAAEADAALVGLDTITAERVIGAPGLTTFAGECSTSGVPLVAAAGLDRFVPETLARDQAGFESLPLGTLTAVITEEGPLRPEAVAQRLRTAPISPALLQVFFPSDRNAGQER